MINTKVETGENPSPLSQHHDLAYVVSYATCQIRIHDIPCVFYTLPQRIAWLLILGEIMKRHAFAGRLSLAVCMVNRSKVAGCQSVFGRCRLPVVQRPVLDAGPFACALSGEVFLKIIERHPVGKIATGALLLCDLDCMVIRVCQS